MNPNVSSGINAKGLWWALTTLHGDVSYWHPLTWISHQLDFHLFKMNAGAHHLTSALLHAANTVLVFLIATRVTGKRRLGCVVALFFAIHPLRVESVAWLSERKDVLCAFFYLATIQLYFRYSGAPTVKRYFVVLVCFLFALMSKPMAVTLPCLLLLLDVWPLRRFAPSLKQASVGAVDGGLADSPTHERLETPIAPLWLNAPGRRLILVGLEKIPLLALAAVVSVMAVRAQQDLNAIMPAEVLPLQERLANAAVSYVSYLHKTVLPVDLAVHYAHPLVQPLWLVGISAAVLAAISGFAARARFHHPLLLFGWLWFLGTLVPAIGIIQAGSQAMADRYTYIPSVGLMLMIVGFFGALRLAPYAQRRILSASVVPAVILMAATWKQLWCWKDTQSLFQQALRVNPVNYVAHNNLGKAYERFGQTDLAIAHFQASILANPSAGYPKVNMGRLFLQQGKPLIALQFYDQALRSGQRTQHLAHHGLGATYRALGNLDLAIHHFRQAIRIKPSFGLAKIRLADILATAPDDRLRNGQEAVKLALKACEKKPHLHADFLNTLAAAYAEERRFDMAIEAAEAAIAAARKARDTQWEKRILQRLTFYREGRPFRQQAANTEHSLAKVEE